MDRVDPAGMLAPGRSEPSASVARRVVAARERSEERGCGPSSAIQGKRLLSACRLSAADMAHIELSARRYRLSGRGITRVLRVARTIADLEGCERVDGDHLSEALAFRAGAGG
jgi:magnesium chelatase family protein